MKLWYIKPIAGSQSMENYENQFSALEVYLEKYLNRGEISQRQGDLGKAREFYEYVLNLCHELYRIDQIRYQVWLLQGYSRLCRDMGDLLRTEGKSALAKECYIKALELAEEDLFYADLALSLDKPANITELYNRLGDLCKDEGDFTEAGKWYRQEYHSKWT